jgi:uncharacterized membrane protein YfhO
MKCQYSRYCVDLLCFAAYCGVLVCLVVFNVIGVIDVERFVNVIICVGAASILVVLSLLLNMGRNSPLFAIGRKQSCLPKA